ncbi:DNA cytosine methyltransferase [Streptomyces sp. NRRL F-5630]|uniref:DNA cytosine methyltransferase n=1 Tax=Streptomyces sp. NRRL F-5630 TaxID=1463864 RepID=UPI003EBC0869
MAVCDVLGAVVAWHSQYDPTDKHQYAARILAHHWPDVPNHGDITAVDWSQVEPVDVLTAGFPCQDVSLAGLRAGLAEGTRSGLWAHVARAISVLRPRLVVIENVRGLLSATAARGVGPDGASLDENAEGTDTLRAVGAVLGDLADLGLDAEWHVQRASDVGAPHQRERVFVIAWPASHADDKRMDRGGLPGGKPQRHVAGPCPDASHPQGEGWQGQGVSGPTPKCGAAFEDPDRSARGERGLSAPGQAAGGGARADARGRGRALDADTDRRGLSGDAEPAPGRYAVRSGVRHDVDGHDAPAPYAESFASRGGRGGRRGVARPAGQAPQGREAGGHEPSSRSCCPVPGRPLPVRDWGVYAPAVERWEEVTGRRAPWATDDRGRLPPEFVEWMMGLEYGHVTAVPGLSRPAQLKALGNGVVPQQAAHALRFLLRRAGIACRFGLAA